MSDPASPLTEEEEERFRAFVRKHRDEGVKMTNRPETSPAPDPEWWWDPNRAAPDFGTPPVALPDGTPFAVAGLSTNLWGAAEGRKTTMLLVATRQAVGHRRRVLWLSETPGWRIAQQLANAGGDPGPDHVRTVPSAVETPQGPVAGRRLAAAVAASDAPRLWLRAGDLVVIDTATEFGGALNDAAEYREWHNEVAKPWAAHGCAVVIADHVRKSSTDDDVFDGPLGSGDKMGAIDLGFRIEREGDDSADGGSSVVTLRKDRYGLAIAFGHRKGSRVASVRYSEGRPLIETAAVAAKGLADAMLTILETEEGEIRSKAHFEDLLKESGRDLGREGWTFREAVNALVNANKITAVQSGDARNSPIVYKLVQ